MTVIRHLLWKIALILCLSSLAWGCGGLKPAETPDHLPGPVQRCAEAAQPDARLCAENALDAVVRSDRASAGQSLLGVAATAAEGDRDALLTAGLWVTPSPWLPKDGAWSAAQLEQRWAGGAEKAAGAFLVAKSLRRPAAWPKATRSLQAPLAFSEGEGLWSGDRLAALTAASLGASGVLWADGAGTQWLIPAAPLLTQALGIAVALPVDALAAAEAVTGADRAFGQGHTTEALVLLERARSSLDASAPPCRSRGALRFLIRHLGKMGTMTTGERHHRELAQACFDAKERDERAAAYLSSLATLIDRDPDALGDTLRSEHGRSAYLADLSARLGDWSKPYLTERLRALVEFTAAAAPVQECSEEAPKARRQRMVQAAWGLVERGEEVVGLHSLVAGLFDDDERVIAEALLRWREYVDGPRRRWLRRESIRATLQRIQSRTPVDMARLRAHALCRDMVSDTIAAIQHDQGENAMVRHATRVIEGFELAPLCGGLVDLAPIVDAALQAAFEAPERGPVMVELLGVIGLRGIQLFLSNQGASLSSLIGTLSHRLQDLRARLGDSDDDRVLGALLEGVVGLGQTMLGQPVDIAVTLGGVSASLAKITGADSDMQRLAPGLRLTALELALLFQYMGGDVDGAQRTLTSIDSVLAPGITSLLGAFGVEGQRDDVAETVRLFNLVAPLVLSSEPSEAEIANAFAKLRETPEISSSGWWRLGVSVTQALLWDAMGLKARGANEEALQTESMENARRLLDALAAKLPEEIALEHEGWSLLPTLPYLHEGLMRYVHSDEEQGFVESLELHSGILVKGVLLKLVQGLEVKQTEGIAPVLAVALSSLAEVDLDALFKGEAVALQALSKHLVEAVAGWPVVERMPVMVGAAGVLLASGDFDAAKALLGEASRALEGSSMTLYTYMPFLVALDMVEVDPGDPKAALDFLDQIFATRSAPGACVEHDVIESLSLQRAWLLERIGQHEAADATLAGYAKRTGEGAPGNARVQCNFETQRGQFVVNGVVELGLSGLLIPTPSNQHSFQIGVGWQEYVNDQDSIACYAYPTAPAFEQHIRAQLARAAYALRSGDGQTVQFAIDGALSGIALLVHGSFADLGADASGFEQALTSIDIELIRWVSMMARLNGHPVAAFLLDDSISALRARRRAIGAEALDEDHSGAGDEIPGPLRHIDGIEALEPLLLASYPSGHRRWQRAEVEAALGVVVKGANAEMIKKLYLAGLYQRDNARDELEALFDGVARPEDPELVYAFEAFDALLLMTRPAIQANVVLQQIPPTLEILAKGGRFLSLTLIGNMLMTALDPSERFTVNLFLFLQNLPPEAGWSRVLASRGSAAIVKHHLPATDHVVFAEQMLKEVRGRLPLQEQGLYWGMLFNALASAGDYARLRTRHRDIVGVVLRTHGFRHPTTVDTMTVAVALDISVGLFDPVLLNALSVIAGSTPGVSKETLEEIKAFKQLSEEERRGRAQGMVRRVFLGSF